MCPSTALLWSPLLEVEVRSGSKSVSNAGTIFDQAADSSIISCESRSAPCVGATMPKTADAHPSDGESDIEDDGNKGVDDNDGKEEEEDECQCDGSTTCAHCEQEFGSHDKDRIFD